MQECSPPEIVISGVGVTSAIGQGRDAFLEALLHARQRFQVMSRPGRQRPAEADPATATAFLGAEIADLALPDGLSRSILRTASFSGQVALTTLHEAWSDARLDGVEPDRIGLIVGGSNFQQRELVRTHDTFKERPQFLRPTYGMSFMDTDVCGLLTEQFPLRAFAYTVGGASASGQAAVIEAALAVRAGRADVCIAIGALMDLSYWECQGLRSMGAMGSDRYASTPQLACRPFDHDRDGFIFGEACGVLVVESLESAIARNVRPYARLAGCAIEMDGNRNPNPSCDGETRVIRKALHLAGLSARDIDYVNPHGTASRVGDETELEALRRCELTHARINATKSITGHGLSAAGAVEIVATLLQMRAGRLHPTHNLENPIDRQYRWVQHESVPHAIRNALNLSFGFGGINTALCLQAP